MSKKPNLLINEDDMHNNNATIGMTSSLQQIIDSDLFDIGWHKVHRPRPHKYEKATIIIYEGKQVFLDYWDYHAPTYTDAVYKANFDLIIKVQHDGLTPEAFEEKSKLKKVLDKYTPEEREAFLSKIVAWTFFPSKLMTPLIGHEEDHHDHPVKQVGFFCGKNWKCRHYMQEALINQGINYIASNIGKGRDKQMRPLTDEELLEEMKSSKYGIVLPGRRSHFTEAKNRREIDYMMLKKPLLINYRPHYYNPLIEGYHYIYIDDKTDIENLETMYNMEQLAENGYQWYKDNASPMGVAKTLYQILAERLGALENGQ